ncbi:MAG: VIT1/CCC1 transporter family protein [Thermoanaerobaculia bacterium]|nr:VIT1/CCC1 transporter family protein [Thermoanaerobaculia bacterium]
MSDRQYRSHLTAETDSAFLYDRLADLETNAGLARVYRRMAESERRHAAFWAEKVGVEPGSVRPSRRARILAWIARRFGVGVVLPIVVGAEQADAGKYSTLDETRGTTLAADESGHRRLLSALGGTTGGLAGGDVARLEGRHRAVGGNALRAAVLGANDGLVSNLSLVMGVAGAALEERAILLTGFAGLLAGAISMALGEWLSVQSSRELYGRQIEIESAELAAHPEEEAAELALIYESKGVPPERARELAASILATESRALDTLAREELGIDPEELGGSAWEAALTSFVLFALGAIIPVGPFLLLAGQPAVTVSLAVSAVGLFGIGAAITLLTGRGVLFSGFRQMAFGLAAAAVTYGIGWLVGVSVAG